MEDKTGKIGDKNRPVSVISGASSGFGVIYARRFAAMGHDLLLIARRRELLEKVADEITAKYPVRVEVISADLSKLDQLSEVQKRIESLSTIEYMVNSAGFGLNQAFPDVRLELETRMIQVHCIATMRLCYSALIPMTAKKSGKIINIASAAGFLSGDHAAEYTGTKAYIITFSRSLQSDVQQYGIRVQALCPGFVRTEFHDSETMAGCGYHRKFPGFLWIGAEKVVSTSLSAINRRFFPGVVCIPTFRYKLIAWAGSSWFIAPFRILFSRGRVR